MAGPLIPGWLFVIRTVAVNGIWLHLNMMTTRFSQILSRFGRSLLWPLCLLLGGGRSEQLAFEFQPTAAAKFVGVGLLCLISSLILLSGLLALVGLGALLLGCWLRLATGRSLARYRRYCCMKHLLLPLLALTGLTDAAAQRISPTILYPRLSKTLDSLAYVDQWPMQRMFTQQPDSAGRDLVQVEKENFARHQPLLEKIVRQHGYPGVQQVGKTSAYNFWLLVQHADAHLAFQRQVLKLMLPEVKRKNADPANYAYLTDRVATNTGQPEEYGTQVEYKGLGLGQAVPKSLRDPAHVNQRRAAIGMEPLENYLSMMTQLHVEMNTPKAPLK